MLSFVFRNEGTGAAVLAYSRFLKFRLYNFSILGADGGKTLIWCPQTPYLLQWRTLAHFLRDGCGWGGPGSHVEADREESYRDGTEP